MDIQVRLDEWKAESNPIYKKDYRIISTSFAEQETLYHKDSYGYDELIGNAKVTESGLKIIGGKFYSRQ